MGRSALGALASLADHAQAQDQARIRRWLTHSSGVVRSHALRGLVKAQAGLSDAEVAAVLDLGGNRLLRALRPLVSSGQVPLDGERVMAILSTTPTTIPARHHLRELLKALGIGRVWHCCCGCGSTRVHCRHGGTMSSSIGCKTATATPRSDQDRASNCAICWKHGAMTCPATRMQP